jgi:hypothetical protein
MMIKKTLTILAVALCAVVSAFATGKTEDAEASFPNLAGNNAPGTAGWEDIDGLSSASILREPRYSG